jgi:hypothetical protein
MGAISEMAAIDSGMLGAWLIAESASDVQQRRFKQGVLCISLNDDSNYLRDRLSSVYQFNPMSAESQRLRTFLVGK